MSETQVLNELKSDVKELESLLGSVIRSNVRQIIADSISSLRLKIEVLESKIVKETTVEKKEDDSTSKPTLYTTKITNYGWDENIKFVKLYVTLPNIEKVTEEQISSAFTDVSFKVTVSNHNGKNHVIQVVKLAGTIIPELSHCRVKNGNLIITLKKDKEAKTWGNLTEADKKQKETKDAKYDTAKTKDVEEDPSAGVMNLMKKMYDEGDDEMKRMIKKSWYESQQKQKEGGGGLGGMEGMGGMGGMPPMPASY